MHRGIEREGRGCTGGWLDWTSGGCLGFWSSKEDSFPNLGAGHVDEKGGRDSR